MGLFKLIWFRMQTDTLYIDIVCSFNWEAREILKLKYYIITTKQFDQIFWLNSVLGVIKSIRVRIRWKIKLVSDFIWTKRIWNRVSISCQRDAPDYTIKLENLTLVNIQLVPHMPGAIALYISTIFFSASGAVRILFQLASRSVVCQIFKCKM